MCMCVCMCLYVCVALRGLMSDDVLHDDDFVYCSLETYTFHYVSIYLSIYLSLYLSIYLERVKFKLNCGFSQPSSVTRGPHFN